MKMDEKKTERNTETMDQKTYTNACAVVAVSGDVFPIPMTLEEFENYQKLLEEEKSSKS